MNALGVCDDRRRVRQVQEPSEGNGRPPCAGLTGPDCVSMFHELSSQVTFISSLKKKEGGGSAVQKIYKEKLRRKRRSQQTRPHKLFLAEDFRRLIHRLLALPMVAQMSTTQSTYDNSPDKLIIFQTLNPPGILSTADFGECPNTGVIIQLKVSAIRALPLEHLKVLHVALSFHD